MILDELIKITPQRELLSVAMECGIVFADHCNPQKISDVQYVLDPLRSALDHVKENRNDTALVIQDSWFTKVSWGPNWMRGLQLWNEIQTERARKQ
ncbi:hypothetical protein LCGC14_0434120 [marine sediment metagenome]|uniref:Uncharacterized protein n=1 Tax=marine sediment metagenome TaxID=412755 RepID=A0A0F9T581_9ZZZZ